MLDRARAIQDQISRWRREIHQHPEIGFTETQTAALVAQALRQFGLRVETGVGKTGVVGHLGSGSPVVGLRADMDALPLQEANADALCILRAGRHARLRPRCPHGDVVGRGKIVERSGSRIAPPRPGAVSVSAQRRDDRRGRQERRDAHGRRRRAAGCGPGHRAACHVRTSRRRHCNRPRSHHGRGRFVPHQAHRTGRARGLSASNG